MDLGFTKNMQRIGERFRIFRLLVLRSRKHFSLVSGINEGYLEYFEKGLLLPETVLLATFSRGYGLNLTWLIFGEEGIFYKKVSGIPGFAYEVDRTGFYKTKEFRELFPILETLCSFDLTPDELHHIETLSELIDEYATLETFGLNRKVIRMPELISSF